MRAFAAVCQSFSIFFFIYLFIKKKVWCCGVLPIVNYAL